MPMPPEELAKRARALAQAHPLTPLARRYQQQTVTSEGASQPLAEIGIWAGAALLAGYCLRRVEESEAGLVLEAVERDSPVVEGVDDLDELVARATEIASEVRAGIGGHVLGGDERVIRALDLIVASEVDKRLHNWRENFDQPAWTEFEQYMTWWVVQGYAVRVAEMVTGAVA
ncbi:MAG: hypothetical protein KY447_11900 [Actinobacteria bacterium]|nr:hypothetical protein [Actinomycetota bacterium]